MSLTAGKQLLLTSAAGSGAYQVSRSLRFNSPDSAYLSRTPSVAGNRKTWTWAGWVKRSKLGGLTQTLMDARTGSNESPLCFNESVADTLSLYEYNSNYIWQLRTTQVFRDASAWYHMVAAVDTTQATASNRVKIYVNRALVTDFAVATYPSQNYDTFWNTTNPHVIGQKALLSGSFYDGYLADIYFIDGQALDPSSFTTTDPTTGQLIPKAYEGTYGTNGFHLPFSDNSATTATTLGKDTSGNGNNWTPNNFSVTAGAGNDSLVDTPTSYGTDTGAGGEVRGNYATLNPLHSYVSLASNGNLDCNSNGSGWIGSTIHVSTGKWYTEFTVGSTGTIQMFGVCTSTHSGSGYPWQASTPGVTYYVADGRIYVDGVNTGATTGATNGDIISLSFDVDAKSVVIRKNNSVLSTKTIGTTSSYMFYISDGGGNATSSVNFGQRPFAYTAPSGFKALCDTNLAPPLIAKPSTVFNTTLWTGNGSTQTINGLGFSPDFVWIKQRNGTVGHLLYDQIRGGSMYLQSNTTGAEGNQGANKGLYAFTSDGFSVGDQTDGAYGVNGNNLSQVAWCWDAGTSTVTNTQGSITSSVRANASAGFSVVSAPISSSGGSIGHGLNVSPGLIIVKNRGTNGTNWVVWHSSLGTNDYLLLNSTSAKATSANLFNGVSSTTFTVGSGFAASTLDFICYCFAPVAGYSLMGSYVSTGTSDNAFNFCGFKPRFLLLKNATVGNSWVILDSARSTFNAADDWLGPNSSSAEDSNNAAYSVDFLSNGFKVRSGNGIVGNSGDTVVWAAFAESPFVYARAR